MKKIALFFVMCLFLFGCASAPEKGTDGNDVAQNSDKKVASLEGLNDTSVVWRVQFHPLGGYASNDYGVLGIALENGKRLSFKYFADEDATKDVMFLAEGDTVIYRGSKVISVILKKRKEL